MEDGKKGYLPMRTASKFGGKNETQIKNYMNRDENYKNGFY